MDQSRLKITFRDRASFQEALQFLRPRVTSERRLMMSVAGLSVDDRVRLHSLGATVREDAVVGELERRM